MTTTPPAPASAPTAKKPWYKKIWVWAIVAAVVVIGGIMNLVNPKPSAEPTTPPAASSPAAEAPTPASSPTTAPEPQETAVEEQPAVDDAQRSAQLEQALKDSLGVSQFSDLLATDGSLWGGYVSGVRVEGANAFFTLQIANDDPNRKPMGERAAQALSTLLSAEAVKDINWLIVEDASGVVIDQKQPTPIS